MNTRYVILDVGKAFEYSEFNDLFNGSLYKLLYIGEQYFIDDIKPNVQSQNVEYWSYEELYAYSKHIFSKAEKAKMTEVIDYVVNDKLTTELFDRTMAGYFFNYSTKNDVTLIRMTLSAYRFVLDYKPSFMLLFECSHNIRSWVVAKVCEYMNIPIRYCRNHIFMWRNVLLEGMCRHPILLGNETVTDTFSKWENEMYLDIEARYAKGTEAIKPEYLEVMKQKKMKKIYSLWKDVKMDWKHPYYIVYKYFCYKAYEKQCNDKLPEKYIAFYLHLQPERTTLPEGYGFTQQYKAISLLNEMIPNDWKIVVKEHPATFYRYCTPMGRWRGFYESLASLDKVQLVPLEMDTYEMMTKASSVSTITGTVSWEGMVMGKPVIMFGIHGFFGGAPYGLYEYEDDESLQQFIDSIHSFDSNKIKSSFREYIQHYMMNQGVMGISENDVWNNSYQVLIDSNRRSRFKLMKYILGI